MGVVFIYIFFFKHKTAYEMRISDWSSDVCSSDLALVIFPDFAARQDHFTIKPAPVLQDFVQHVFVNRIAFDHVRQDRGCRRKDGPIQSHSRSEEHTSELQSLMRNSYAVVCLTKKKKEPTERTHV